MASNLERGTDKYNAFDRAEQDYMDKEIKEPLNDAVESAKGVARELAMNLPLPGEDVKGVKPLDVHIYRKMRMDMPEQEAALRAATKKFIEQYALICRLELRLDERICNQYAPHRHPSIEDFCWNGLYVLNCNQKLDEDPSDQEPDDQDEEQDQENDQDQEDEEDKDEDEPQDTSNTQELEEGQAA